jgi:hypothetical protein
MENRGLKKHGASYQNSDEEVKRKQSQAIPTLIRGEGLVARGK